MQCMPDLTEDLFVMATNPNKRFEYFLFPSFPVVSFYILIMLNCHSNLADSPEIIVQLVNLAIFAAKKYYGKGEK